MKKIVYVLMYGLLLAVTVTGMLGIRHFIIEEESRVQQEAEKQLAAAKAAEEKAAEKARQEQMEKTRMVLVKTLPVYQEKKIVKIKAGSDTDMLSYGDKVVVLEEDELYAAIQTENGQTGYVWRDCIGKLSDKNDQPRDLMQTEDQRKVVVIDVEELLQKDTAVQEEVSLRTAARLEKKLKERGYVVVMSKRSAEHVISNAKSAELANQIQADAVVRICAFDHQDQETDGTAVYCSAKDSRYPAARYAAASKKLGKRILKYYTKATGFDSAGVLESDDYIGIRRGKTPVVVLKLGNLSDEAEKSKMNKPKFQAKMARGIADGVDAYFNDNFALTAE